MAIVKKISELTPKGSALANTDLLVVGVDNGTDYDLKSVTGAQLLGTVVSQTITNGVTTKVPSEDVVFDALALKVDKVTGSRLITSAESTLLGNTSGTNTGDQDLSGKVDKVVGKGLSTEDYTTTEKNKLAGLTGTNTGDQTLQQVTDKGNITTQQLITNEGVKVQTLSSQVLATINSNIAKTEGKIFIADTSGNSTEYKINEITKGVNSILLPSSAGTLALTSDLTTKVTSNTAITGATKTKITYDAKGLVTSGTDATTADIADSLNKRYVTDANLTVIGNTSGTNTGDQTISDATITITDITTNNFSTTKHGFVPKGTNVGNYLKDDGTWSTISAGGLTHFTEAQSTASPNATVNVDSLTAIASTTNADFVVRPKGTGAILGNIPDSTITGGNKRGANAVDLQTIRSAADEVASGTYSVIAGGQRNTAPNSWSSVLGGFLCSARGDYSSNLGGYATTVAGASALGFGSQCQANGVNSIALGSLCVAGGQYSIAMGNSINVSGRSSIALGETITMTELWSFSSGYGHSVSGRFSNVSGKEGLDNGVWSRSVFSSSIFVNGDSQSSKIILNTRTTGTTPTVLTVQNNAVASTTQLTLANNNSIRFKGTIIARQSGSTNTSAWDIDGIIQRGVGVGTTTLLISNVNVVQNTPAWGTPTLTANTTLGCLTVTVTGATANIQWTCVIDTAEVIYA